MIVSVYESRKDITPLQLFSSLILFLVVSFLLFYSFINICFQTLLNDPSKPFMLFCLIILLIDNGVLIYYRKKITVLVVINILIVICILVAWALDTTWAQILGITIFLKCPEIIQFNSILYDKLNTKRTLSRLLIILSHVIGCIFYLIDDVLIKQKYFGELDQNPTMYYQGSLTCFTPIYALSESLRYVYCVYYSISLVSTVAFGDIIPKNPFQNIYVMFLLILATVGIGLILEEMIVFFRKQKLKTYEILKKIKYVKYLLSEETNNKKQCQRLIRFLIYEMSYYQYRNPRLSKLTHSLGENILKESVRDIQLPMILKRYLVCHTKSIYFPRGYEVMNNQLNSEEIYLYIMIHGKIQAGYGKSFYDKNKFSSRGFLFGYEEMLTRTKSVNPHYNVVTQKSSMFLMLTQEQLKSKLMEVRKNEFQYLYLLESLQLERQKCLTKEDNPYRKCTVCQSQGHLAYECEECHYRPKIDSFYTQKRNQSYRRQRLIKNKKILGTKSVFKLQQVKVEVKQQNMAIQYCKQMLNNFIQILEQNENVHVQKLQRWKTYHPEFNIY